MTPGQCVATEAFEVAAGERKDRCELLGEAAGLGERIRKSAPLTPVAALVAPTNPSTLVCQVLCPNTTPLILTTTMTRVLLPFSFHGR